ncbi:MAG TPA: PLP-dependent cysteine synthase family protein [Candidatus Polarisedimenticolaceae bacterium]|nr:PLP-dependent cysteine synthase family protein [Candidatus Polarisedimenticolaceae bacterium]
MSRSSSARIDDRQRELPGLFYAVGGTRLRRLERVAAHLRHVALYAKAEHLNPSGSVKDRAARAILLDGLRRGRLLPGKTVLEATSGNTGIALAMLARALGHEVRICLPANASAERKRLLHACGACLELTDRLAGTDGAILRARALYREQPGAFFYGDQYGNDANWRAHFQGTGPEIWEQTGGRITHFVAGIGTSGTFVGTTRYLKARNPAIVAVSMEPDTPLHGLEGLKHLQSAMVPAIYDPSLADARMELNTEEGLAMARRLAVEEDLCVGPSAGANVAAALRVAEALPRGADAVVVTVLPDHGSRYP